MVPVNEILGIRSKGEVGGLTKVRVEGPEMLRKRCGDGRKPFVSGDVREVGTLPEGNGSPHFEDSCPCSFRIESL